jgi:hypothetical protein
VPIALVRGVTFVAHRERRAGAVLLLLLLAVVIVAILASNLANLEPVGESRPVPGPGQGGSLPDVSLPPQIWAVSWVLAVVVLAGLVLMLLRRKASKARRNPSSWWPLGVSAVALVLLLAFLASRPTPLATQVNETADADGIDAGSAPALLSTAAGWPVELLFLITVFGSILWVLHRVRRGGVGLPSVGPADSSSASVRVAAVDVVQETIRELEIGADVRMVIFACFQRFCRLLRSRGIADQDTLTPRELEVRAVRDLAISREASGTLTSLFEEARYSEHPLGDVERGRAINSLERIRAALEA